MHPCGQDKYFRKPTRPSQVHHQPNISHVAPRPRSRLDRRRTPPGTRRPVRKMYQTVDPSWNLKTTPTADRVPQKQTTTSSLLHQQTQSRTKKINININYTLYTFHVADFATTFCYVNSTTHCICVASNESCFSCLLVEKCSRDVAMSPTCCSTTVQDVHQHILLLQRQSLSSSNASHLCEL